MTVEMTSRESDESECEHLFLDRFLGLGIGWYDECKRCGAKFIRVQDEPGFKDWHYEKLEDLPSSCEPEKKIEMAAGDNVSDVIKELSKPLTPISMDPRFCQLVNDVDPFSCSSEALDRLVGEVPAGDRFAAGYLTGVADFRRQLALITGRGF